MAFTPTEATPLLGPQTAPSSKILSETKVYPLIHLIRVDIMAHIDAPLTYEQLLAPDSTYTIIRPLTEKYLALQNQATVFCLLLNKIQFTQDSRQLSIATLSLTRSTLCEILASRVLRGWSERSLPLATVLLTPWSLFQGASEAVIERAKEEGDGDLMTQTGAALEMAIVSGSKRFIRSPSCQKVIEGIWSGRIIYSALNAHALIADNYKKKPIQMYNPHRAPVLDHYRLKVPRYRSMLEYFNFLVLFILYVVAIEGLEEDKIIGREWAFIVYAMAFSLDKLAAIREHGLKVFSSSLVNGFDLVFLMIYGAYMSTRMYGMRYGDRYFMEMGADWLAIGAVLMFPRLAFVTLANNLMVLSIRSMLTEFFFLMGVGVFCFAGFVYALFTLGQGKFDLPQIGWWLLEIYFGLDASGFEHAHYFHPFLGPLLMVSYALLSNTLLLTVLVAILGNTFATINADAAAESMFRKAVSTIEGVKADAVFSYQLPFNLPAVVFMFPMRYLLNDRWFHKVNVFMIRVSSVHILLLIALYERQSYKDQTLMEQLGDFAERYVGNLPRRLKAAAGFDNFTSRSDLEAVFEIEREVGSFYAGWDDDLDLDEPEIHLPPAFENAFADDSPEREGSEDENGLGEGQDLFAPQSAPLTASLSGLEHQIESPRPRRNSMPSPHRAHTQAVPQPSSLRRRNSSMHGPSPLAQLFVRSPESEGLRGRRTSLAGMVATSVQPAAPSVFTPPARKRGHSRSESFPATSSSDQSQYSTSSLPRRGYARPSVAPITEGKTVSFASHLKDSEDDGVVEPGPLTHNESENEGAVGRGGVPIGDKTSTAQAPSLSGRSVRFPKAGGPQDLQSPFGTTSFDARSQSPRPPSEKVVKASDVESLAMAKPEEEASRKGVQSKLDDMDKRQRRMEEMMESLLSKLSG